jgi:hypothetical protein
MVWKFNTESFGSRLAAPSGEVECRVRWAGRKTCSKRWASMAWWSMERISSWRTRPGREILAVGRVDGVAGVV